MRLRTFTAPDMPTAMQQVREALGDDAVILSSQAHGKKSVSVTAAVETGEDSPPPPPQAGGLGSNTPPVYGGGKGRESFTNESLRFHIQEVLRFHNIPELFIAKIINADRGAWQGEVRNCLEKLLAAFFTFEPLNFPSPSGRRWREAPDEGGAAHSSTSMLRRPHPDPLPKGEGNCIMLIGPPGIGKTLTIARMAVRLTMDKRRVLIITTDNKHAGGVEQLQAFINILEQPLQIASSPRMLAQYLKSAEKYDFVLIDTAGCNPYDKEEVSELTDFALQEGIEPVLALPAGGDSLEAIDIAEAFMAMPVKRLLVTRADTARRFGGVLAAAAAHGLAFCNASRSSSVTDPPLPLDEALLAQFLLRYQLQRG